MLHHFDQREDVLHNNKRQVEKKKAHVKRMHAKCELADISLNGRKNESVKRNVDQQSNGL